MLKSLARGSINRRCCSISYHFQKEEYMFLQHHKHNVWTLELATAVTACASRVSPSLPSAWSAGDNKHPAMLPVRRAAWQAQIRPEDPVEKARTMYMGSACLCHSNRDLCYLADLCWHAQQLEKRSRMIERGGLQIAEKRNPTSPD